MMGWEVGDVWRDWILGGTAALSLIGAANALPFHHGRYCVRGPGKSYDMLLVREAPDGTLAFGLSSWTQEGSNFAAAGTAVRSGAGWIYRDNMQAADPQERCGITLTASPDGTWRVTTIEGARCEAQAGHGAELYGTDVFPPRSRVGDAPARFSMEDLAHMGCSSTEKG